MMLLDFLRDPLDLCSTSSSLNINSSGSSSDIEDRFISRREGVIHSPQVDQPSLLTGKYIPERKSRGQIRNIVSKFQVVFVATNIRRRNTFSRHEVARTDHETWQRGNTFPNDQRINDGVAKYLGNPGR